MKQTWFFVCSFIYPLFCCGNAYSQESSNPTAHSYLGQTPPNSMARVITPNLAPPKGWELGQAHDQSLDEFYFTPSVESPFYPTVIVFRKENNVWQKHQFHSMFSGNENRLYDEVNYIERTDDGWSKIKSLGLMFDRDDWGIMRLTSSAKGSLVFDDARDGDRIRMSRMINGKHEPPKLLDKHINTGKWTAHPFIAHDDSYLIWDSEREEGRGGADIYISFLQEDDTWGPAINFGDSINSELWENAAMVTLDGKYILFSRSKQKVREDGSTYWTGQKYWVDAQIIEQLRVKHATK